MNERIMTELQEEPAIFQLIRNRDVSIDAIRLYLKHYPKRLHHPVHGDDTILSVAVKECFALDNPEVFENGDINALLIRQISILSVVAEFVNVSEIISGESIFHILLQLPSNDVDEVDDLSIAMYKLISNAILDVLLKYVTVSDEANILFLRNNEAQLALHIAIFHDNHKAARKLLDIMRFAYYEYSHYEYIEPDRKIPLLHYLLMHSPSSKVICLIFAIFPDAASTTDSDGVLPIAVALENSLSHRKIELIINMYPQALSMANSDGDLPLHIAAMDCPHQFDILELLIDRYEAALQTQNHNGQLPLHCCLEYQNNGHRDAPINLTTIQILSNYNRASTSDAIEESDETISGDKLNDDSTANTSMTSSPVSSGRNTIPYFDDELHESPSSDVSLDQCKYAALCHRDSYGEIPLHIACRGLTSSSFEILSWLLECYPESASSRNKFGHLPMHLFAASEVHDPDDDIIEQCFNLLLNAYPCALYTQDNEGDIPLQCLLTHSDILPSLMHCLVTKMTRISEKNLHLMENPYTRQLPLHTACLNGIYTIDVMNQLISLYPEALLHFDVDGLLPFHVALESPENCNDSILKTLLYRPTDKAQIVSWQSTTLPCTAEGLPALFFACENVKSLEEHEDEDDRKIYECKVLDVIRFLVENSPELFTNRY
jgi:hypothetical protein